MKRAIFAIPEGTTIAGLTPEQQAAIASVFAQFTLPMPGTVAHDGQTLVDGIVTDNFDPGVMPALGLDWTCLGLWYWDEHSLHTEEIIPFNLDEFMHYVPDINEYDEEGNIVGSSPAPRQLTHNWAGWPVNEGN